MGELLHCATPARVAISEWVGLARTYSGESSRRLMNGVLGRVVRDTTSAAETARNERAAGRQVGPSPIPDHREGAPE
jgi:hypothetical protein